MSATTAPYRSTLPAARDGFGQLLHAEWTKFRTVRGWVITAVAAGLLIVLFAYLGTFRHENGSCIGASPSSASCQPGHATAPLGPGGKAVTDTYSVVHRTLRGDGSITVRIGSLSGRIQGGNANAASAADMAGTSGPVQPWAKAGVIVTSSTTPGSAYAAVLLTGAHGVRLQSDYIHDIAGPKALPTGPRWLRLTRSGATLTGYASADGTTWIKVGSAHLGALPAAVQAGLVVTSPQTPPAQQAFGSGGGKATAATATFDHVGLQGAWSGGWRAQNVGANGQTPTLTSVGSHRSGSGFTLTGSGDIAPAVDLSAGYTDQTALTGVFVGLIVMVVLGAMFITTEYRRGLILTTLTARPRRGQVLIAKAVLIAAIAFLVGAGAAAVSIPLGNHLLRSNGNYVYPTTTLTQLRVVLGTGALVALVAMLALALGTALRRSAGAVTAVIALVVLPYVLAFASALPAAASEWLMRVTPAAGFAIQQTLPQYHQVAYQYTPANGFYPLAPGVGLAVLGAYTLAAMLVAHRRLLSRDA